MRFKQFLNEEDKKKVKVFAETDGRSSFPEMAISALQKNISAKAKDLEVEWNSVEELVSSAFEELDVPKPQAHLTERWKQYVDLLSHAMSQLYKARGMSKWTQTI